MTNDEKTADALRDVENALGERRRAREWLQERRASHASALEQLDKAKAMLDAAEARLESADRAAQKAIDSAAKR